MPGCVSTAHRRAPEGRSYRTRLGSVADQSVRPCAISVPGIAWQARRKIPIRVQLDLSHSLQSLRCLDAPLPMSIPHNA
eukprot:1699028-Rhodomonas_salina.3